ncbi:hypothetical protein EG835_01465 [bacterium]|nr:hypothetical protein [bacterium]
MFSDVESFALLFMADAIDHARAAEHAATVVEALELDPRLAVFIPPRPRSRKHLRAYEQLLAGLQDISWTPEPERTRVIGQVHMLVDAHKG